MAANDAKDAKDWQLKVDKEHYVMVQNDVWEVIPREKVPPKTKILHLGWVMKSMANGNMRALLNTKGCSQVAGHHYVPDNLSSPVANTTSMRTAQLYGMDNQCQWCISFGWIKSQRSRNL